MKSLLAIFPVALALSLAACGGSKPTVPPPTGNFSNASLRGQYAFLMSGVDRQGAYIARIGSFSADGAGHITAALEDVLSLSTAQSASLVSFTGGSYEIQASGRGLVSLQAAGSSLQLNLVLQSASAGFLVQTDLNATSSGTFHLQSAADFSPSSLNKNYVFDFNGVTFSASAAAPISLIGEVNLNGGGSITGGLMDTNNGNLAPSGATPITPGSYAIDTTGAGTTFGRGTLTFAGYTFAFYIIDSTHLVVLEEDNLGGTSGDALAQSAAVPTQNSQFTGTFLYLQGGASVKGSQGPVARVTRVASDGNGNLGDISLDDNNDGRYSHVSEGSNISNASYAMDTANAGTGRGTLTFTDSGTGTYTNVFYLISSTDGVVQVTSAGIIGDGPMTVQTGGPFALSGLAGNFVFNWSGVQLGANTAIPFEEDFVGQYALTNASSSNISGVIDYVELGLSGQTLFTNVPLGGTLTIKGDGTANNLYKFAINGTSSSTINFQAYFANPSTVYLVSSDTDHTTAGILKQQ